MFDYFGISGNNKKVAKDDEEQNLLPETNDCDVPRSKVRFRGDKRLIERGGDFKQSTGKIALRKKIKAENFRSLYSMDLFHSLVDAPTSRIIMILMGGYMLIVVFFALVYLGISKTSGCNLDLDNFTEAFGFSLETMATIGYGTTDIFFDDCIVPLITLSLQVCVKLIADAVTIGVLYCKLSRPHARASTVIFSDKAVIRRVRGKLYFMFQLCELRKHQLVEAHVRVYVVRNEVDLTVGTVPGDEDEQAHERVKAALRRKASEKGFKVWPYHNAGSMSSDEGSLEGLVTDALNDARYSRLKYHSIPASLTAKAKSTPVINAPAQGFTAKHTGRTPPIGTRSPVAYGSTNEAERVQKPICSSKPPIVKMYPTHQPSYVQTSAVRLNHPNDELGGMLLLMTPQVVVHEIDAG
jgi:hypothetical protein